MKSDYTLVHAAQMLPVTGDFSFQKMSLLAGKLCMHKTYCSIMNHLLTPYSDLARPRAHSRSIRARRAAVTDSVVGAGDVHLFVFMGLIEAQTVFLKKC